MNSLIAQWDSLDIFNVQYIYMCVCVCVCVCVCILLSPTLARECLIH